MQFQLLYKLQESSIDQDINNKTILFPNAFYEINNNFVTKSGIDYIKNAHLAHDEKGHSEQLSYRKDLDYFTLIGDQISDTFFSVWKKEYVKSTFFESEADKTFEDIFSNKNDLIREINDRIFDGDAAVSQFYNSSFFWATKFDEISLNYKDLTDVIFRLGLNHYCQPNLINPKELCGLIFKIENKKIFKPNFLSNPSAIGYCGKPVNSNSNWGATVNLRDINRGCSEALIPHSYFRDTETSKIVDICLYDTIEEMNFIKENVIDYINSEVNYNSTKKYKISNFKNTIKFKEE